MLTYNVSEQPLRSFQARGVFYLQCLLQFSIKAISYSVISIKHLHTYNHKYIKQVATPVGVFTSLLLNVAGYS